MLDQISEVRYHLGRTSSEVDRLNFGLRQPQKDPVDRLPGDRLRPLRAGVHVAMGAGEIANLAQIELKNICPFTTARQLVISQGPGEKLTDREINLRPG
jgi:hypothetical protein